MVVKSRCSLESRSVTRLHLIRPHELDHLEYLAPFLHQLLALLFFRIFRLFVASLMRFKQLANLTVDVLVSERVEGFRIFIEVPLSFLLGNSFGQCHFCLEVRYSLIRYPCPFIRIIVLHTLTNLKKV